MLRCATTREGSSDSCGRWPARGKEKSLLAQMCGMGGVLFCRQGPSFHAQATQRRACSHGLAQQGMAERLRLLGLSLQRSLCCSLSASIVISACSCRPACPAGAAQLGLLCLFYQENITLALGCAYTVHAVSWLVRLIPPVRLTSEASKGELFLQDAALTLVCSLKCVLERHYMRMCVA